MPINGAIHSACTAVSRAISNWWTAGFVLSASHKIPKGALMAICNLQRQVMIFHILRRSGFGSKLSSFIILIRSTRNMADFMEKWRSCWNGSVCVPLVFVVLLRGNGYTTEIRFPSSLIRTSAAWTTDNARLHEADVRDAFIPVKQGAASRAGEAHDPVANPPVISKPRRNLSIAAENDELHQLWSVAGPSPHQNRRIGASDETKASIIQHSLTHTKAMAPPLE